MGIRIALVACSLLLLSCEGDSGDVCQVNSDCGSSLVCCKVSQALTSRGTCEQVCDAPDASEEDGGEVDDGSTDASSDAMSTDGDASTDGG
ncbi:MAG: hypothetical protein R3A78_13080 [Polyangiales bacterium]